MCISYQGLWRRLVSLGPTDDPLSSAEYGTILGKHYIQFDWESPCKMSQLDSLFSIVDCPGVTKIIVLVVMDYCFVPYLIKKNWNKLIQFL